MIKLIKYLDFVVVVLVMIETIIHLFHWMGRSIKQPNGRFIETSSIGIEIKTAAA